MRPSTDCKFKAHLVQAHICGEDIIQMSFEILPDELLPAVFSHLSPGMMLKLSLVRLTTLAALRSVLTRRLVSICAISYSHA